MSERSYASMSPTRRPSDPTGSRYGQAELAKRRLDGLTGLALKVACLVLDQFPYVIQREHENRTDAAIRVARNSLSRQERRNTQEIERGVEKAKLALAQAYQQIGQQDSRPHRRRRS